MSPALLAAAMILIAVLTVLPRRSRALHRLTSARSDRRSDGAAGLARSVRRRLVPLALSAIVALGIGLSLGAAALVSTLAVGVVLAVITTQRARARRLHLADQKRAQVIEACDTLAAELAAGRPPHDALEGAAEVCAELRPAAAAARLGGDVPAVLQLAADTPGAESLKALAAAWQVADRSGAAVAAIVDRLAASLRAEESLRRQIATNLAGARTTARLLAILPLFGTLLGYALGADPLTFLTTTIPGAACLTAGLALAITGLWWTERLATYP
ncbi:type II secretion system protein [Kribbella flavida DSM 17836]|uniref:Type II secretion system protein n=1 Tax=Kribbella flavida (strain DSM 17836 / JCM 10339 / NBRC 14399) TaxID=479435 RepID=D2PW20_KRIFD|nr:type II secretion system F family protein [Kribbella flavida]ADB29677.1 type II secretion system protein [Kribbella flavida DSM 17836]